MTQAATRTIDGWLFSCRRNVGLIIVAIVGAAILLPPPGLQRRWQLYCQPRGDSATIAPTESGLNGRHAFSGRSGARCRRSAGVLGYCKTSKWRSRPRLCHILKPLLSHSRDGQHGHHQRLLARLRRGRADRRPCDSGLGRPVRGSREGASRPGDSSRSWPRRKQSAERCSGLFPNIACWARKKALTACHGPGGISLDRRSAGRHDQLRPRRAAL